MIGNGSVTDIVLRVTVWLILVTGLALLFRQRRPLWAVATLQAGLVGLFIIPAVSALAPRLTLAVLPVATPSAESASPAAPTHVIESLWNDPTLSEDNAWMSAPLTDAPAAPALSANASTTATDGIRNVAASLASDTSDSTPVGTSSAEEWRLGQVLMVGYLLVGLAYLLRLAGAWWGTVRLRQAARDVSEPIWQERFGDWRERFGIRGARLLFSDDVPGPVAVGIRRPAVIIPTALLSKPELANGVLLHELAHVARRDSSWQFAYQVALAAFWFHPLAWLLGSLLAHARERVCDDLCVHHLRGEVYGATLLDVACAALEWPHPALGLPMARSSRLAQRLRQIKHSAGWPTLRLGRPAAALVAGFAMTMAIAAGAIELARAELSDKPTAKESAPTPEPAQGNAGQQYVTVEVLDARDNKPLAGTTVRTYEWEDGAGRPVLRTTDPSGLVQVPVPKTPGQWMIDVFRTSHVPQRWRSAKDRPERITFRLWPGEELGGIVRDEAEQPIHGAVVYIWGHNYERRPLGDQQREILFDVPAPTDEQGRWSVTCAPQKLLDISVRLEHPEFITDSGYGRRPPIDELRSKSAMLVMKKGIELRGRVVDGKGRPVADARVLVGRDRLGKDYPEVVTDAQGQFRFGSLEPKVQVITVQAKGFAPALREVLVEPGVKPPEFHLSPPAVITGQVLDTAGKPIADATVVVDAWRAARSLKLRARSDKEGRFRLEDAPADPVLLSAWRDGYESIKVPAIADQPPVTVTLFPRRAVRGRVVDATTNRPIPKFEAGRAFPDFAEVTDGNVTWQPFGNGEFELETPSTEKKHAVAVKADGYRMALSATFETPMAKEPPLEIRLERVVAPPANQTKTEGIVLQPDGEPAKGARVQRLPKGDTSREAVEALSKQDPLTLAISDADGRFTFPPREGAFVLYIVHGSGYFQEEFDPVPADPFTVKLHPWATLEGTVRFGNRLGADVMIRYSSDSHFRVPGARYETQSQANGWGRYTLRVPPGRGNVYYVFEQIDPSGSKPPRQFFNQQTTVEATAGETVTVDIGGKGRPVTGQIVLPPDMQGKLSFEGGGFPTRIERDLPTNPCPMEIVLKGTDACIQWMKDHPVELQEFNGQRQWINFNVDKGGHFRAEDIPPGNYRLVVLIAEPWKDKLSQGPSTPLGRFTHSFTVAPMPDGRSDEPLDLGIFTVNEFPKLAVDKPAPPIQIVGLDDQPISQERFRDKYVLLYFWSNDSKMCRSDIERLRKVNDELGKDGRVVILSVNIDADKAAWKRAVAERGMSWLQGHCAPESPTARDYFVRGTPSIHLIDPDGKLIMSTSTWEGQLENPVMNLVGKLRGN